jgi:hypothetical protein
MTSTQLEYASRRIQQKWHDLIMAEQKGASKPVLERMYNAYMLAVEEYNRCSAAASLEQEEQTAAISPERAASPARPLHTTKRRRKAS